MRIGIDLSPLTHSAHRGIGAYARSLLEALRELDHENEYVLFLPRGVPTPPCPRRSELVRLPELAFGRGSALVVNQIVLPIVAARANIDVLHVLHSPVNPSQPLAPVVAPAPVVITLHDLTPLHAPVMLRKWRWRTFYRLALHQVSRAGAVITDSCASADDAIRHGVVAPHRIFVAPLAAPLRAAAGRVDISLPPAPYAVNVGSDDWNKNRDALLAAFQIVARKRDLRLVLVGGTCPLGGPIDSAGRERVIHFPWLPDADLDALYEGATMFIFPSRYEGFGLPILEAMRAGTPVITSAGGATEEVAGDAALLVDPEDPLSLADAMVHVLDEPVLADELRRKGRRRERTFTWERTAETTLQAYAAAATL